MPGDDVKTIALPQPGAPRLKIGCTDLDRMPASVCRAALKAREHVSHRADQVRQLAGSTSAIACGSAARTLACARSASAAPRCDLTAPENRSRCCLFPCTQEIRIMTRKGRCDMDHPKSSLTRLEIEDLWRSRVETARARCNAASAQFNNVIEEFQKGVYAMPDGGLAISVARREESAAREEYMRVLRIFTDLLTKSKLPEE